MEVKTLMDASKHRQGRAEALALAHSVRFIHVARGKKRIILDLKKDVLDDDALVGYLLGPSGNLRAPTIRRGDTLYVGFHEAAYQALMR